MPLNRLFIGPASQSKASSIVSMSYHHRHESVHVRDAGQLGNTWRNVHTPNAVVELLHSNCLYSRLGTAREVSSATFSHLTSRGGNSLQNLCNYFKGTENRQEIG